MIDFKRHSPSSLNLFAAAPAMFVLEKVLGLRQPVGVPAHRGTAVEDGVTAGLLDPQKPLTECFDIAFKKYDTITALSSDKRRAEYRDNIPEMVTLALEELRPYCALGPPKCQGFVEWHPNGLKYPIVGYYDYHFENHGILIDLKTSDKMPSSVKVTHARQTAFYASRISDNLDVRVTYTTPKKKLTYKVDSIRDHANALHQMALRCEAFLALSDDPDFFKKITVPDLESFYWNGPPARQLAFEIWGI